ncbi:cupin domain-containing protein [Luteimicrobium sp. NPDC057192]|uniref:cupin domain-containing protein n=1 Tax=Luteimicrobium sp. NPDC057192 TaxID=3346042 RepID=UPI00363F6CE1
MSTTLTLNGSESLVVRESTPDRFEVEATYGPSGSRPPKHVHPHHDEEFTVLAGTIRVGFADHEQSFTAGESFVVPRGTPHHMWNAGDEPAVLRWLSTPAGRVEEFFTAMDRLQRAGRTGLVPLAGVLHRYRDVMRPTSVLIRAAVRLLGPLGARR